MQKWAKFILIGINIAVILFIIFDFNHNLQIITGLIIIDGLFLLGYIMSGRKIDS